MHTENSIVVDAPAARIYELGARIEDWPAILPHYRGVHILRDEGVWRLAEMAATRDGIPVTWAAIQELDPAHHVIRYRHVRGVTRGMTVAWTIIPAPGGMLVRIAHDFEPPWPRPLGPLVARYVVGDLFVHNIAGKTLRQIKRLAERGGRREADDGRGQPVRRPSSVPSAGTMPVPPAAEARVHGRRKTEGGGCQDPSDVHLPPPAWSN